MEASLVSAEILVVNIVLFSLDEIRICDDPRKEQQPIKCMITAEVTFLRVLNLGSPMNDMITSAGGKAEHSCNHQERYPDVIRNSRNREQKSEPYLEIELMDERAQFFHAEDHTIGLS